MISKVKNISSFFLLLIFTSAIIPAEGFHHHEEQSKICKETSTHVEVLEMECQLADFVFPLFIKWQWDYDSQFTLSADLRSCWHHEDVLDSYRFIPMGRAPPQLLLS